MLNDCQPTWGWVGIMVGATGSYLLLWTSLALFWVWSLQGLLQGHCWELSGGLEAGGMNLDPGPLSKCSERILLSSAKYQMNQPLDSCHPPAHCQISWQSRGCLGAASLGWQLEPGTTL